MAQDRLQPENRQEATMSRYLLGFFYGPLESNRAQSIEPLEMRQELACSKRQGTGRNVVVDRR